jgi:hypothetical protein
MPLQTRALMISLSASENRSKLEVLRVDSARERTAGLPVTVPAHCATDRSAPKRDTERAMSPENLDVCGSSQTHSTVATSLCSSNCCDPDIEIEAGRVLIGTPTYRGYRGVEQLFRDMRGVVAGGGPER